jgi:putative transposase
MKFQSVHEFRGEFAIAAMCKLFGVSLSGYYAWKRKAPMRNDREQKKMRLVRTIEALHLGSRKRYGSPRIGDKTKALGIPGSHRTVARRMAEFGIKSKLARKFKVTTDSKHKLPVAPNHLMQDFSTQRKNQVWMSDITFVETKEGWLYVCAVLDLHSRRIVGWAASSRMTRDLVITAYMRARRAWRPSKWLIFHSDRGSQYCSKEFRELLSRHNVIQSMSRRANCWDSAPIESFWGRLKTEHVYWEAYVTRQEAVQSIHWWIEFEYNGVRAHRSLGSVSPREFEKMEVTRKTA